MLNQQNAAQLSPERSGGLAINVDLCNGHVGLRFADNHDFFFVRVSFSAFGICHFLDINSARVTLTGADVLENSQNLAFFSLNRCPLVHLMSMAKNPSKMWLSPQKIFLSPIVVLKVSWGLSKMFAVVYAGAVARTMANHAGNALCSIGP